MLSHWTPQTPLLLPVWWQKAAAAQWKLTPLRSKKFKHQLQEPAKPESFMITMQRIPVSSPFWLTRWGFIISLELGSQYMAVGLWPEISPGLGLNNRLCHVAFAGCNYVMHLHFPGSLIFCLCVFSFLMMETSTTILLFTCRDIYKCTPIKSIKIKKKISIPL